MDRAFEAGDIVVRANRFGQFEHAHKMRRHELAVGDPVVFDRRQRGLGIEPLHHHHGPADLVHGHRPAQRRGMIKRCGGQIAGVAGDPVSQHRQLDQHVGLIDRRVDRQWDLDPLGPPGGARRIEHVDPGALVGDRNGGQRGERLFGVHAQAQLRHLRGERRDLIEDRGQIRRAEQQLGRAVFQDIGHLGCSQAARDANEVDPGALKAPGQAEEPRVIFQTQRHGIAHPDPARAQQLRNLVRAAIELGIGYGLTARRHDDRGFVGMGAGVNGRMHGRTLHCRAAGGSRTG